MKKQFIGFEPGGIGYAHLIDETLDSVLNETESGTITLYHGLKENGLSYVLSEESLHPRVCAEGGPKAIYFSEYPLNYYAMTSIEVPKSEIGSDKKFKPYANTQYISLEPISIHEYNFKILKIGPVKLDDKELIKKWREWWDNNDMKMINAIQSHFNDMEWYDVIQPLLNRENNDYTPLINENAENEVEASEVSLSSFKPQKELNDKLWINNKLNSRVRLRLLDIADDFIDTLGIDWVKPKDIIFTGSLVNYNWSKYSDIDLHILIDFKEIDNNTEFVKEYFDSKKNEWNNEHDELRIYGFPVEVYVQDSNEEHLASGIYSIEKNKWIINPNPDNFEPIKLDKFLIKNKAAKYMTLIDHYSELIESGIDEYQIDRLSKKIYFLLKKLKNIRSEGLKNEGEMSIGNILYKVLRRTGYLDKLYNMKTQTYDKLKSL